MRSKFSPVLFLVLTTSATFSAGCVAEQECGEPIVVNTTTDKLGLCSTEDCSLREAVILANTCSGSSNISLPSGIYKFTRALDDYNVDNTGEKGDLDVRANISITGAGRPNTIIDGNFLDRIFDVHSGHLFLTQVSLQNGQTNGVSYLSKDGAGIRIREGASAAITQSSIRNNTITEGASAGGGIHVRKGSLTVVDTEITGNRSHRLGGGIFAFESRVKLISTQLTGNKAWAGGAVWFNHTIDSDSPGPDLSCDNCYIANNEALHDHVSHPDKHGPGYTAGIYSAGRTDIINSQFAQNVTDGTAGGLGLGEGIHTITDTTFEGNQSVTGGAGIANDGYTIVRTSIFRENAVSAGRGGGVANGGSMEIYGSTFESNSTLSWIEPDGVTLSSGEGGAIANLGILLLSRSLIRGNTSETEGGGLLNWGRTTTLWNNTFTENTAGIKGGAIHNQSGTVNLKNNTMVKNTATSGNANGLYNSWHPLAAAWANLNHTIISANGESSDDVTPVQQCFDPRVADPQQIGKSITSIGFNIASDDSCILDQHTDQPSRTAALNSTLAYNGGTTMSYLPVPYGNAHSQGANATSIDWNNPNCLPEDQRGYARPYTGGYDVQRRCDIGSIELKAVNETPLPASPGDLPERNEFAVRLAKTVFSKRSESLRKSLAKATQLDMTFLKAFQAPKKEDKIIQGDLNLYRRKK